jgi:hypothetical protein
LAAFYSICSVIERRGEMWPEIARPRWRANLHAASAAQSLDEQVTRLDQAVSVCIGL